MLTRAQILPESDLPDWRDLVDRGKTMARDWRLTPGAYLTHHNAASETEVKRRHIAAGTVAQHAQIGYRNPGKTGRAWAEIHETCAAENTTVERYGVCLDWSMGVPRDARKNSLKGTGLILNDPQDFATLTAMAPVAPHFGDFVLGFPAAIENTQAALAAGSSFIGNLGQYFTFRLPGFDDDIEATKATLTALALIAAQPAEVAVHSNLDDGFAAQFADMTSSIGAALIERYIVTDLLGAPIVHCWGHHFSNPFERLAFHIALSEASPHPGSMIYANTTSYRGGPAQNYAALGAYLSADIHGQALFPSGHAVNPAPVTENQRIPDIDEIIDAQLFAGRLIERQQGAEAMINPEPLTKMAAQIGAGGRIFRDNVLNGLTAAGIDIENPFEMLLAIRRIGGRALEAAFGASRDLPSPVQQEIDEIAAARTRHIAPGDAAAFAAWAPHILVAATDVHEHGARIVEQVLTSAGATIADGGVSATPQGVAAAARAAGADAIALSTYNGVALSFYQALAAETDLPILIGGRLNQVPDQSNTSLPTDVSADLTAAGALICTGAEDAIAALLSIRNREPA